MKGHEQLVQLVEKFRTGWAETSPMRQAQLQDLSIALAPWGSDPVVTAFRADLADAMPGNQVAMRHTQKAICASSNDQGVIVGVFRSPYNPKLALDALTFERIKRPKCIPETFESSACPIKVVSSTSGFNSPRNVAIFMEELNGVSVGQMEGDKAFYLIDRFAQRSFESTRPLAISLGRGALYELFRNMTRESAMELNAGWVWLHEHFHRTGPLPLPKYLGVKGTRSGGAFEELRADLNAIMACLRGEISGERGLDLANFIFAERLLRYGTEAHPMKDYDSRSSNVLFGLLRASGADLEGSGKLELSATTFAPHLEWALQEINRAEAEAAKLSEAEARAAIQRFALDYLKLGAGGEIVSWPFFNAFKAA